MKYLSRSVRQILMCAVCFGISAMQAQAGFLYAERDSNQGNQIFGFEVNEATGALTALSGFPISTGGAGRANGLSEFLTIDQANRRLYVLNDSDPSISAYSINPATGALTPLPFSNFLLPVRDWTTIAVHPSGSPLTVAEKSLSTPTRVASYNITATTRTPAPGSPFSTAGATSFFGSVFSRDGNYFYGGGNVETLVTGMRVNQASGELILLNGSPFNGGAGYPTAYATDSAGRLYLTNYSLAQSSVFTTTNGVPAPVSGSPFPNGGLTLVTDGVLHPNENFYAVSNRTPASAGVLRISGSGANTTLTPVAGSPVSTGGTYGNALVFNQAGTFLFVANGFSRNITTFSFNPATGTLANINVQPANTLGSSGIINGIGYLSTTAPRRTQFDFDGDSKADVSVFRSSNGTWYLNQTTSGFAGVAFGVGTDKLVPADYDGDGKTDVAVFRNGIWYLQRSGSGFTGITFGASDDIPVPADFNGDGKSEIAVFRPSNGTWYFYNLTTNQTSATAFGQTGDKPVAADYDGDSKADVAVFRSGTWYIQRSQLGFMGIAFGALTDKPVVADYDGDGKADVAVFRPSNGTWYLQQSQAGFTGIAFGLGTDAPTPADYDGDGKVDIAVFREGTWYLQRSQAGFTGITFGAADDIPIPFTNLP